MFSEATQDLMRSLNLSARSDCLRMRLRMRPVTLLTEFSILGRQLVREVGHLSAP